MSDEIAPHRHFQYASADHQSDTAIAGKVESVPSAAGSKLVLVTTPGSIFA